MASIRTVIALYDEVTGPLKYITDEMHAAINAFSSMQAASSRAVDTTELAALQDELTRASTRINEIENAIRSADSAQGRLNRRVSQGDQEARKMLDTFKRIAKTIGGIWAVRKTIDLSDEMAGTRARLELIVDDGGSVDALQSKIMASAQDARASYLDTLQSVSKLGLLAGDAFASNDEMIRFAELMNKNFAIAGASEQMKSSAMYQLNQALGSGRLQGDEYRSIIENAPLLAQAIEDYMRNVKGATGAMKDWSSQGLLTADVIKNALFASAEEVEERFRQMPRTWGQVWTSMMNRALIIFDPILKKINDIANSERTQGFVNGVLNAVGVLASALGAAFDLIAGIGAAIYDNWSWLSPIILGVAGALGVYYGAQLAANIAGLISKGVHLAQAAAQMVHLAATGGLTTATAAATATQYGLNAALYACPVVWVIGLVLLLVAAYYALVAAVNHFAETSVSATGLVAGAFGVLLAFLHNTFFVPLYNTIADTVNFLANVFKDPVSAINVQFYNMVQSIIGYFLNLARAIESVINKIPGVQVDITSGLDGFYRGIQETAQKYKDKMGWVDVIQRREYWDYTDAAGTWYDKGESLEKTITGLFTFEDPTEGMQLPPMPGMAEGIAEIVSGVDDTAGNTARMADALELSENDLSLLREIAERKAIDQYTTAEIRLDMTNYNNVASEVDLDGILNQLAEKTEEAVWMSAEGVHV